MNKPTLSKGLQCKYCKEPVWVLATKESLIVVQAINGAIFVGTHTDEITRLNPTSQPVMASHEYLCPETKVKYS